MPLRIEIAIISLLLLLRRFSRVQLCATPPPNALLGLFLFSWGPKQGLTQ